MHCDRAWRRRGRCAYVWSMAGLLAVLLLPHVCSSDVADDADGTSGAAEEAHELLRRGSGQVCAPRACALQRRAFCAWQRTAMSA